MSEITSASTYAHSPAQRTTDLQAGLPGNPPTHIKGKIRHLFPGGNTSIGFFSYYSNIITQEEAERLIILKGGPGVGKSTFMKRIGTEMLQRGYDVEYLHCSSDNNSLDGIAMPTLKTAIIDGTAPHQAVF